MGGVNLREREALTIISKTQSHRDYYWKRPLNLFITLPRRHFTMFAVLFSLVFLVVSFQDSQSLEEPVKVLKVG